MFRWVQCFTPLLADAARPCRHAVGDRWYVDETYVRVAGRWRYVYRAIDQRGQIIDVFVSARRDTTAARRFFETALGAHGDPVEVVTDRAPALRAVIEGHCCVEPARRPPVWGSVRNERFAPTEIDRPDRFAHLIVVALR